MKNNSNNNTPTLKDTRPIAGSKPVLGKPLLKQTLGILEVVAIFDDMTIQVRGRSFPRVTPVFSNDDKLVEDFLAEHDLQKSMLPKGKQA